MLIECVGRGLEATSSDMQAISSEYVMLLRVLHAQHAWKYKMDVCIKNSLLATARWTVYLDVKGHWPYSVDTQISFERDVV